MEDLGDRREAEALAARIVEAMREPVLLGDTQVATAVSIGICFSDDAAEDADTLLRDANFAICREGERQRPRGGLPAVDARRCRRAAGARERAPRARGAG